MQLTSTEFANGATIPTLYTCDGQNVSPPLDWTGVPAEARYLALFVEDPDAPGGTFVHWALFDIDPSTPGLGAGSVPPGVRGAVAYRGPCPPKGSKKDPHHYEFRLYALKERLPVGEQPSASDVRRAIAASHPLAEGRLVGRYGR